MVHQHLISSRPWNSREAVTPKTTVTSRLLEMENQNLVGFGTRDLWHGSEIQMVVYSLDFQTCQQSALQTQKTHDKQHKRMSFAYKILNTDP